MAALNSSGPISLAGTTVGESIEVQLGGTGTTQISLNDAAVRTLAGIASGAITMPTNFWGKGGSSSTTKGIFSFGGVGAPRSITLSSISNQVSNTGVVAGDTAGAGTSRRGLAACTYGGDKGIFGYGYTTTYVSMTNLLSNTGVISGDTAGVGTSRSHLAACTYGGDKGIFAYGTNTGTTSLSMSNLVSNTGVVATDTTGVGTARQMLAACSYGGDKGIFGYGGVNGSGGSLYNLTNLVSNTGVISGDVTGVGTARILLTACTYGGDKGVFYSINTANLVSNTGVVAANTTTTGTSRTSLAGCGYGGDKGIFGYGGTSGVNYNVTNLVSNTGVVSGDVAGVGTARQQLSACGYSTA